MMSRDYSYDHSYDNMDNYGHFSNDMSGMKPPDLSMDMKYYDHFSKDKGYHYSNKNDRYLSKEGDMNHDNFKNKDGSL